MNKAIFLVLIICIRKARGAQEQLSHRIQGVGFICEMPKKADFSHISFSSISLYASTYC